MATGLGGTVVAETELSSVDGTAGDLLLRGHRIEELLQEGPLPDGAELAAGTRTLGVARLAAWNTLDQLGAARERDDPMEALRCGPTGLDSDHPDGDTLPGTAAGDISPRSPRIQRCPTPQACSPRCVEVRPPPRRWWPRSAR